MSKKKTPTPQSNTPLTFEDKAADFVNKNGKNIIIGLLALLIIGAGFLFIQHQKKNKQQDLMSQLYDVERTFQQRKREFEKNKSTPQKTADDKKEKLSTSGDLAKDFPEYPEKAYNFVKSHASEYAGQLGAINLAQLYMEYGQNEKAKEVLALVADKTDKSSLIHPMVQTLYSTAKANNNDVDGALAILEGVSKQSKHKSFVPLALFKMGNLLMKKEDWTKAKTLFQRIKDDFKDSDYSSDAEKFIRFIETKTNKS